MTEQQQPPEKIELLTQGVQHEMTFNEGIGVIKNYASKEWCKILINAFEMYNKTKLSKNVLGGHYEMKTINDGESQFKQGSIGRKDEQLFLEVADPGIASTTNEIVGGAFEHYVKEYRGVIDSSDPVTSWTCKIQKTQAGGGYHIWHCEDGSFLYRDRVLTWMMYLNDIPVENGGATDFLHQKCSFQPTVGTMVMWPATYTHMHRGSFLTGDIAKYIATGWFLREPGDVSNRIIGESRGILPTQAHLNK
tara:strand:- start:1073 stop:1819 length:747 start_codon:yes stop_codon:yes gene_type:complete